MAAPLTRDKLGQTVSLSEPPLASTVSSTDGKLGDWQYLGIVTGGFEDGRIGMNHTLRLSI